MSGTCDLVGIACLTVNKAGYEGLWFIKYYKIIDVFIIKKAHLVPIWVFLSSRCIRWGFRYRIFIYLRVDIWRLFFILDVFMLFRCDVWGFLRIGGVFQIGRGICFLDWERVDIGLGWVYFCRLKDLGLRRFRCLVYTFKPI